MTRHRRVLLVLGTWVLLVAASFLWQRSADRSLPAMRPGGSMVEVDRMSSAGPMGEGDPVRLEVIDRGDPEASDVYVALHGSPSSGGDFVLLHEALDRANRDRGGGGVRLVEIVQPGFGASDGDVPDFGIEAAARMTLAVMDRLGIARAHLVGHSLGGGTILHVADIAPERVRSLTSYGGIGLQEHEGTGDHALEHLKYRIGWWLLVAAPEVVPHFGALGDRDFRRAFIRNFMDTDQRSLRPILESIDEAGIPFLILHGRHDPLVPARAARAHHALVERSELVMFDRSHFMIFDPPGAAMLAAEIDDFARRIDDGAVPIRRTVDPDRTSDEATVDSPFGDWIRPDRGPWVQFGAIVLATQVLEDPTTIAVGMLVRKGLVDPFLGMLALIVGIVLGDLLLYGIGRLGGATALKWDWVRRRTPTTMMDRFAGWFDRSAWWAIFASRLLPGARVPMYVAIGAARGSLWRFILWVVVAVSIWVPMVVIGTVLVGPAVMRPFEMVFGEGWIAFVAAIVLLVLVVRLLGRLASREGRRRIVTSVRRAGHWEFWPFWAAYGPLFPWFLWHALVTGYRTVSTVNPCWSDGGTIGESKREIMELVDPAHRPAMVNLDPGTDGGIDVEAALGRLREAGLACPVVVKPDAGERGAGVRFCDDEASLRAAIEEADYPLMVQARARGPYEAGVFWYRMPGESEGRVYSVTEKVFPVVIGDGRTTLRELVWRHPRYRLQYLVHEERFGEGFERVLDDGEALPLTRAGNHSQGTMFREGGHLLTDANRAAFDRICGPIEGFNYGRFDVRCADEEAFRSGDGLEIIEVNGLSSESTDMYDPDLSIARRWSLIVGHWRIAIRIGRRSRAAGVEGRGWVHLLAGLASSWWGGRRPRRLSR